MMHQPANSAQNLIIIHDNKVKDPEKKGIPALSLVLVCYNQRALITESINSITNQLASQDELIILDDGSSDGCAETAAELLKKLAPTYRTRVVTKPRNMGVNHSINLIPSISANENIVALAGDDFYYPGAIDRIRSEIAKAPTYSAIFSSCNVVDINSKIIGETTYPPDFAPHDIYKLSETGASNIQGHSLVCWSTKILTKFGNLDASVSNEDDQIILRSTILGNVRIITDKIRAYRKSEGSMSSPHVAFQKNSRTYLDGLRTPLLNRIANYRAIACFIENTNNKEDISEIDRRKIISNYQSCIACLSAFLALMHERKFLNRTRILASYIKTHIYSRSIYYRQNFIISLSHDLYFKIKKFLYLRNYES